MQSDYSFFKPEIAINFLPVGATQGIGTLLKKQSNGTYKMAYNFVDGAFVIPEDESISFDGILLDGAIMVTGVAVGTALKPNVPKGIYKNFTIY